MNTIAVPPRPEVVGAENRIAALLTIVPGLGHIYKGHLAAGFIWMFFGMPLAVWDRHPARPGHCRGRSAFPDPLLGRTRGGCLLRARSAQTPLVDADDGWQRRGRRV